MKNFIIIIILCLISAYFGYNYANGFIGARTNSSVFQTAGDYYILGNLGVGTTTPVVSLIVQENTSTSTIWVESATSTKGACLKLKDTDGVGYTYCAYNNGTQTCTTTPCN